MEVKATKICLLYIALALSRFAIGTFKIVPTDLDSSCYPTQHAAKMVATIDFGLDP